MNNDITKEQIKLFAEKILDNFQFGELIPHNWVKHHSGLVVPQFNDFENQQEFITALEIYNFAYMSIVDRLRSEILENYKYYLKNIRGDGYTLLPPHEQTSYANEKFANDIKKIFRTTSAILSNINYEYLSAEARKENADSLAKISKLKHLINYK